MFNEVIFENRPKFEEQLLRFSIHDFMEMNITTLWSGRVFIQSKLAYPKAPEQLLQETSHEDHHT